jgi:hypothetical protein
VDAEPAGDLAGERVVAGVEFRPAVGDRAEVGGPVGARGTDRLPAAFRPATPRM